MEYIDLLDHYLDMTVEFAFEGCGREQIGCVLLEEIDKAHRRGAISCEMADALYANSEIAYYLSA